MVGCSWVKAVGIDVLDDEGELAWCESFLVLVVAVASQFVHEWATCVDVASQLL